MDGYDAACNKIKEFAREPMTAMEGEVVDALPLVEGTGTPALAKMVYSRASFGDAPISISSCSCATWSNTAFICIPTSTTRPIT